MSYYKKKEKLKVAGGKKSIRCWKNTCSNLIVTCEMPNDEKVNTHNDSKENVKDRCRSKGCCF